MSPPSTPSPVQPKPYFYHVEADNTHVKLRVGPQIATRAAGAPEREFDSVAAAVTFLKEQGIADPRIEVPAVGDTAGGNAAGAARSTALAAARALGYDVVVGDSPIFADGEISNNPSAAELKQLGQKIKALKSALNAAGFGPLPSDDKFDKKTSDAIAALRTSAAFKKAITDKKLDGNDLMPDEITSIASGIRGGGPIPNDGTHGPTVHHAPPASKPNTIFTPGTVRAYAPCPTYKEYPVTVSVTDSKGTVTGKQQFVMFSNADLAKFEREVFDAGNTTLKKVAALAAKFPSRPVEINTDVGMSQIGSSTWLVSVGIDDDQGSALQKYTFSSRIDADAFSARVTLLGHTSRDAVRQLAEQYEHTTLM